MLLPKSRMDEQILSLSLHYDFILRNVKKNFGLDSSPQNSSGVLLSQYLFRKIKLVELARFRESREMQIQRFFILVMQE